jgi:cell division protein FtsB
MNKIQVLIDNGFITDNDIQEYISSNQDHNEQEEFNDDYYKQLAAENEAAEQLAHELNRTDYIDAHPEYVLASTSDLMVI